MKALIISIATILFFAFTSEDMLTGRWETRPSEKGNVTGVIFRADHSFEAYVNKKPFVTGIYNFQEDIFSFTDNGCDGMQGIYKINFFSNGDSLRFEVISDSCNQRKEGILRLTLGKVK